jgi:hypothetical protein
VKNKVYLSKKMRENFGAVALRRIAEISDYILLLTLRIVVICFWSMQNCNFRVKLKEK